jgi:hypothetical protein
MIVIYFFSKQKPLIFCLIVFIRVNTKEYVTNSMETVSNTKTCFLGGYGFHNYTKKYILFFIARQP